MSFISTFIQNFQLNMINFHPPKYEHKEVSPKFSCKITLIFHKIAEDYLKSESMHD